MSPHSMRIAVVIPCYKVQHHVLGVLDRVPAEVSNIYCVDDACPNGSGPLIAQECRDNRVTVIRHQENRGVGGAVKTGYLAAREDGCDIAVKIDGDGQMDPALIPRFVAPVAAGACDYAKGNRFFNPEDVKEMPTRRLLGNAALSFLSKLSSGYWNLFDPTNGFTALHLAVLDVIPLNKVSDDYFFESDMLFRLNTARCVVIDVPMQASYGEERSNLRGRKVFFPFLFLHCRNLIKRIFYTYFLRDFQVASIEVLLGPLLLAFGALFGGYRWWLSAATGETASAGTVVIAALAIILGVQLILSALSFDIRNVPTQPIHPFLCDSEPRD